MNFTGIDPTTLLKAGAALAAVVVVFYILRLRRRPIAVPFGPLWQRVLRDKEATTLFSQLKRLLSLLLQLALLALLLLALGDPRPAVNETEGRHVVVLIDGSASMKAIDVEQPPGIDELPEAERRHRTRLDQGKERIREVIRGLGGSDRMLIAQMDAAITPLSTMTGEVSELEEALDAVEALDVRADWARGLRFAVDSLTGLSKPEIIVVSDGALGDASDGLGPIDLGEAKLSFVKVGSGARNVAISGFSVRRYPLDKSRYEVLLEVVNTSPEPADVDLELYGDGELTDIVSIRLEGEETLSRFYPNLSGADKTLEARIRLKNDRDLLPADDHAFALLPERRRARVQVVTDGNMYLEAALLLDEYLEVTTVSPEQYPADGSFDVTIFDNVAPPLAPGTGHVFYMNPTDDTHTPFKVEGKIEERGGKYIGFDEIDDKSPIVRHVLLGDVQVETGHALEGDRDSKVVGRSFKGPLLIAGRSEGHGYVALGFDIRRSDLPLRVAWPLLLLNTINSFLEEDTDYISSFTTGEVWSIPASSDLRSASLKLPGGGSVRVPVKNGRAVFLGQEAGFYELDLGPGKGTTSFAANLVSPVESSIAPSDTLSVGETSSAEVSGFEIGVRHEYWIYLLAAVLAVTAVEWFTYHRRVTV